MIQEAGRSDGKRERVWWRRIRTYVFIALSGCAIWLIAMHFVAWHLARSMGKIFPEVYALPTPLMDRSIADLKGLRVEELGFSFQVPWSSRRFERTFASGAAVGFGDGGGLLLDSPQTELKQISALRSMNPHDRAVLTDVLGTRILSSNYEFLATEIGVTPDDAKWWISRKAYARVITLLGDKGADLGQCNSIHPISAGVMRGFQFGDPDVAPYRVNLALFDSFDREYFIRIFGSPEHGPVITQAQINGLIASFVPLQAPFVKTSPASGI